MSNNYIIPLYLKQPLTKEQVQHLYHVTADNASEEEFEHFLEFFDFLLRCDSTVDSYHQKEELKLNKYDEDGNWYDGICISADKTNKFTTYVLALTWARYIYQEFSIPVFAKYIGDYDGFLFLYNEHGLIISKQFEDVILQKHPILGNYRFSVEAKRLFQNEFKYDFADLSKIHEIDPINNRNSDDIIIHCYKYPYNPYYDSSFRPYDDKYYTTKAPVDNPRLIDFCCIGPVQFIVEHSNWHYELIDLPMPLITKTYHAPARWRDVILLDIMESQYFYGDAIVTKANGEIIFMLENDKFIINTLWKEYFSEFPLKEKYTVDEDIKTIETYAKPPDYWR